MKLKNAFAVTILAVMAAAPFSYAAEEFGTLRADVVDAMAKLVSRYETKIAELEAENAKLRAENAALRTGKPNVPAVSAEPTAAPVAVPALIVPKATSTLSASSGNASYDALMKSVSASLPGLIVENNLAASSEIGLFEFVNGKNAFFVSFDDGKNPAGVTAFKTKILFEYDSKLKTSITGVFELDYSVSKYKTVFGTNPYGGTVRTKVKNPSYKGKLFEESANQTGTAGGSASTSPTAATVKPVSTPSSTPIPANVSVKDVRAAYDKNDLKGTVRLADAYLAKSPDDVETLTMRYRSLYILGKYADSLRDIASIERLQGASFDCTIAKDATFIAKSAKNADLAAKYGALCKKR